MKHIRKLMAVGLAIIFLIALVIGTGVILSVRNVNVLFVEYSGEENVKAEYEKTRSNFNALKGSGLLFIKSGDVYGKVTAPEMLEVESYEKKYPCTVNIVLRERVETFTYQTDAGYSVYDDRGKLIKDVENQPVNAVDGCPNVLLDCKKSDVAEIAALCAEFNDKENFGALRRLVASVNTDKLLSMQVLYINLRSGLKITVHEWKISGAQKIKKAAEVYKNLSEYQKISGTITVISGKDSAGPTAKYGV